jgi:hypothetical protein
MTDELAERIVTALETIAFNLSDEGPIAEQLNQILVVLEEITPETDSGRRYMRTSGGFAW